MKKLFYLLAVTIFPGLSFANDMFAEPVHRLIQSLAQYYWVLAVVATLVVCYFLFLEERFSKSESSIFLIVIWLVFLWARH